MNHDLTGIIFKVKKFALHDGPGIRTTVFLKGCPLSCWWCHNPEGISFNIEKIANETGAGAHNGIKRTAYIGKKMTVSDVMADIEKDIVFYDDSGGGVTFSGGEPLAQPVFLKALLRQCKTLDIHTALDTTGLADGDTIDEIMNDVDLFLFDLKFINSGLHEKFTGVSNQLSLLNLEKISRAGKDIIVRIPVVPGITDGADNLMAIKERIAETRGIKRIDILAYHKTGEAKREKIAMKNKIKNVNAHTDVEIDEMAEFFKDINIEVSIGG